MSVFVIIDEQYTHVFYQLFQIVSETMISTHRSGRAFTPVFVINHIVIYQDIDVKKNLHFIVRWEWKKALFVVPFQ